ncbi:chemotaxis protein CheD [Orenia metallireducens]|uniref:chemotaxis protein CheD n=1 Tax=Orenia metallireducens TaxID=1413210 RepID=UPI00209C1FD5|nr:chemotaxis protein CheD [Orenia metallireducens]
MVKFIGDKVVKEIFAGDIYVNDNSDIIISTLLGSCIAVCLIDDRNSVCGMNHFMLPTKNYKKSNAKDGKYGVDAIDLLVREMINQGSSVTNIKAKVFGGGEVTSIVSDNVARANIEFTKKSLQSYSIPIVAKDVGERYGRQIYLLSNGDVYVRRFRPQSS